MNVKRSRIQCRGKAETATKLNPVPCKWSIARQIGTNNVPLQIIPAGRFSREADRQNDVRNIGFPLWRSQSCGLWRRVFLSDRIVPTFWSDLLAQDGDEGAFKNVCAYLPKAHGVTSRKTVISTHRHQVTSQNCMLAVFQSLRMAGWVERAARMWG
jgi:hypothetical protein